MSKEPREQHAQYAASTVHVEQQPYAGDGGGALVLTRRPVAVRTTQNPRQTGERAQVRPQQRPALGDLDTAMYTERTRSSALRYAPLVTLRKGTSQVRVEHHPIPAKRRRVSQDFPFQAAAQQHSPRATRLDRRRVSLIQQHWVRTIGIGMLVMFFGWMLLSLVSSWWTTMQNDWTYGRPRTSQTDAVVGHQDGALDPSHFTVENFNRHVVVIEFQGGDPSKAVSYVGPTLIGPGQDLTPVTVSFRDVNHDGKPDMLLTIEDNHVAFVNTGKVFRPATPADHLTL